MSTINPGLALSTQSDLGAVFYAGRYGYNQLPFTPFTARTFAMLTRGSEDRAFSPTSGASGNLVKLSKESLVGAFDLSIAIAIGAHGLTGARLAAASLASGTYIDALDLYLLICAEDRLLEGNVYIELKVRAASGDISTCSVGGAHSFAEEGVEYITKTSKGFESVKSSASGSPHTSMAVPIIFRTFIIVGQDLIGFIDLFELILGAISFVAVWMVF